MTEETLTLKEVLEHHFRDDEVSFGKIDKRFDKHEELMKINGEHLSHLNKNLVEQNDKIDDMAVSLGEIKKTLDSMKEMKTKYDDVQATKRVIKRGFIIILGLAGLVGAWTTIKTIFE